MPGTGKSSRKPGKRPSSWAKGSSSGRPDSETAPSALSFLFVVNELILEYPERDEYHNSIPPRRREGYKSEIPSCVMRYRAGNVEHATQYRWHRPHRANGNVYAYQSNGNIMVNNCGQPLPLERYSTWSVFACNPLLPIMVANTDPFTDLFTSTGADLYAKAHADTEWRLLSIFHPPHLPGVSQVVTEESHMGYGPGVVRHVIGKDPSWIPSLIPETYRNPYKHLNVQSMGLGGELPIILGLMALTEPRHEASSDSTGEIFLGSTNHQARWRNGEWRLDSVPAGHPASASESPRGFVASVFLDPDNSQGSTQAALEAFEWNGPIVRESHRS